MHNRVQYFRVNVESLSKVKGISETLLIVNHDGYFEERNKTMDDIKFGQVKQVFFPYSPHILRTSFLELLKKKGDEAKLHCEGNPDKYGNHRSPKIVVTFKHHWWWMINTV